MPVVTWYATPADVNKPEAVAAFDAEVGLPNGTTVTVTDVTYEAESRIDEQGQYTVYRFSGTVTGMIDARSGDGTSS